MNHSWKHFHSICPYFRLRKRQRMPNNNDTSFNLSRTREKKKKLATHIPKRTKNHSLLASCGKCLCVRHPLPFAFALIYTWIWLDSQRVASILIENKVPNAFGTLILCQRVNWVGPYAATQWHGIGPRFGHNRRFCIYALFYNFIVYLTSRMFFIASFRNPIRDLFREFFKESFRNWFRDSFKSSLRISIEVLLEANNGVHSKVPL